MTIEIMSAITIISVGCSVFFGIMAWRRNAKVDDKTDATQMATIIVKLDNIDATVRDIKADNKSIQSDVQDIWKRLIKVEEKVETLETKCVAFETKA